MKRKTMIKFCKKTQEAAMKYNLSDLEVIEALLVMYSSIAKLHEISKDEALNGLSVTLDMIYEESEEEVVH